MQDRFAREMKGMLKGQVFITKLDHQDATGFLSHDARCKAAALFADGAKAVAAQRDDDKHTAKRRL